MSLIPSYNFLFNNKDYFLEHDLGDLPIQFIQRIGAFQNCEVVHGVMAILGSDGRCFTRHLPNTSRKVMTQVPLDLIETLSLRIHSGVRFSYIFPSDVVIPKGRRQLLLKFG